MDEEALCRRFEILGVDDPDTLASYIFGIVAANGADKDVLHEALEPYITDIAALQSTCDELSKLALSQADLSRERDQQSSSSVKREIISTLNRNDLALNRTKEDKSSGEPSYKLDKADREATLRLAREMHDKRVDEEIREELATQAAKAEEEREESIAARNRAAVEAKRSEAQAARTAATQKHKAESKTAAVNDKKDKAEKKEERRKKAQKGERHGGF